MSKEMISAIARDFNKNMCSDREVLESCTECAGSIENSPCPLYEIATRIYNAGYRKQRVGEWIDAKYYIHNKQIYKCSECSKSEAKDALTSANYCPNCGAHMRKEDEGK